MSRAERASVNMAASALGYIVPMIANVLATPYLLRSLGHAAYGLQSLAAVVVGYFAVMDMGLEVPVVKILSEVHGTSSIESENRLLSTALTIYIGVGAIGLIVIGSCARWLAVHFFKVPVELIPEATNVFRLAGIGFLGNMGLSWGRALAIGLQRYDIAYGVYIVINTASILAGVIAV
ncbi:MAG: lipopolysaccharide biosynthesis protein, partial [Ktedonobacteraceae bacterium]